MENKTYRVLFSLLLFIFWVNQVFPDGRTTGRPYGALALSTNGRWIVDDSGRRIKLCCVSWPSHLQAVVAEGLSKQPVDAIAKKITSMGFNCVRFTWPLFLATDDSLAGMTVRDSLKKLGLDDDILGFQNNNPAVIDLTLIQAFQAVVSSLGQSNVMVILDNHISKPGWCCSASDGNGFFGDQYFDPGVWVNGLSRMAILFKGNANVVGMSLRNELRGSRQNVDDWYRFMQQGAEAVHSNNPDVLVILSGLNYDKDLGFLGQRPVNLTFTGKTVFEAHRYAFTDGRAWIDGNVNQVCGRVVNNVMASSGFLLGQGSPLFFSEFGIDLRGTNINDNRYFSCFLGLAAKLDFDWALWTLTGSYYLREGVRGMIEYYGVLDDNWSQPRSPDFLSRISVIQSPIQGQGTGVSAKLLFHPATGLCIVLRIDALMLGPCSQSGAWSYTADQTLVTGASSCLLAGESGQSAKLGVCSTPSARWIPISDSRMHLSTTLTDGTTVCLDVNSENVIITSPCRCLSDDNACDPTSQWFNIVDAS